MKQRMKDRTDEIKQLIEEENVYKSQLNAEKAQFSTDEESGRLKIQRYREEVTSRRKQIEEVCSWVQLLHSSLEPSVDKRALLTDDQH